jgi:dephospho-CoA kinase
MLRVALTGGIGTGKSVVLARVADHGIPVADADRLSHEAIEPGTSACDAVRARFGDGVMDADGRVDRTRLGAIVFADAAARRDLEAIIHPAVRRAIETWMAAQAAAGAALAVVEIPLLFETGRADDFDRVVVAACEPDIQLRRVVVRSGLSPADAGRRVAAQLPITEKVAGADYIVRTDGSMAQTLAHTDRVIQRLREDAARATA